MVHGDGQYAPEELPRLLEPLQRGPGRRRLRQPDDGRASARCEGGMPLYKYVGNRSSPPCRTRCWARGCPSSTAATASTRCRRCGAIPFPLNSNDFHFDTEIIIQLLNARAAHRRAADPDLLRRRDLPRERDAVRQGRDAGHAAQRRSTAPGLLYQRRFDPHHATDNQPLRSQARLREQPPVGARRRARGRPRCSTSAPGRAAWPASSSTKGCHGRGGRPVPARGARSGDVQVLVQNLDEPLRFDVRRLRPPAAARRASSTSRTPSAFLERAAPSSSTTRPGRWC